jgi:hypothetical protein
MIMKIRKWNPSLALACAVVLLYIAGNIMAQLQQSGGPGSAVTVTSGTITANEGGTWTVQPGNTANTTAWKVDGTGGSFPISGSIGNTAFALNAGAAIIGFVRVLPPGCASLVTLYAGSTVGVATGAGTSVNSTTTCITFAYANNITNSAVTLRLADKTGTPIIWLGGNADFSIPANSNMHIPIEGVTFTSGITAIAGTTAAINLQINGLQ